MAETVTQRIAGAAPTVLAAEVVAGPDVGATVTAVDDRLPIGTATGNRLVLTDPAVSRFHIELAPAAHGVGVVDHGSTNGT